MKRLAILIALLFASPLYGANEVVFNYGTTGLTLYFVDFNASGQAWDTTGTPAYETFTTTRGDYDIALTEVTGTGLYTGSLPASTGQHYWSIYLQAGGSPSATDDVLIGAGAGYYNGSALGDTAIISAVGSAAGTISPKDVDDEYKWRFTSKQKITADNIIVDTPSPSGTKTYSMEFVKAMNAGQTISSVVSATVAGVDVSDTEPEIDTSAAAPNKREVHLTVDDTAASLGDYVFTVTVLTTDSQTVTRKGKLRLE